MDHSELRDHSTISRDRKLNVFVVLIKRMRLLSALCGASALVALINAFLRLEPSVSMISAGTFVASGLTILQAFVYFRPTTELAHIVAQGELDSDAIMRGIAALAAGFKVMVALIITIAVVVVVSSVMQ